EALSPMCVESTTSAVAIPLCLRRSVASSSNSFGCIVSDRHLLQLHRVLLHGTSGARCPDEPTGAQNEKRCSAIAVWLGRFWIAQTKRGSRDFWRPLEAGLSV